MSMTLKVKGPVEAATSDRAIVINKPCGDTSMNAHSNTTVAQKSARHVDLNTLQSDAWHLYHLFDAAVDCLMELDFVRDEHGHCPLDRVAALMWIARDHAERIAQDIDANFFEIQGGRN